MKVSNIVVNKRKARLELAVRSGRMYPFPFVKMDPRPSSEDPIADISIDPEIGREGVTYTLSSGAEGTVHIEQALDYNRDPSYLAEILTYQLSVAANEGMERSGLSRREVARRLNTSVPQLYRLLDTAAPRKNLSQLISLLHVLDCEVELVITAHNAA